MPKMIEIYFKLPLKAYNSIMAIKNTHNRIGRMKDVVNVTAEGSWHHFVWTRRLSRTETTQRQVYTQWGAHTVKIF